MASITAISKQQAQGIIDNNPIRNPDKLIAALNEAIKRNALEGDLRGDADVGRFSAGAAEEVRSMFREAGWTVRFVGTRLMVE